MVSKWPAVGAETDPLSRARQLQTSWERLLAEGALGPELPPGATAGLRPTIVESWQRSLATGLDPTNALAPIEADQSEVLERWLDHPLGSLTHVLTEQLRKVAEESRGIVVVTDASGLVLYTMGDERLKERAADQNHLVEGARWSEAADGTNGIGTALAADRAVQVFASEHFNERHHDWICSGAPVHDPVSGQTIGLIDLTNLWKIAHPRMLELVTTAARTIDQCLVDARRERDARLRRRYSDLMTRSTDLLAARDGYVLDGAEPAHSSTFDIPEGGGEVLLGDGSVGVAAPLGQGEAYLVRQGATRHARSAPAAEGPERAEERARELAGEQAALRQVATLVARESSPDQLFAVVAEQVARVLDVPLVRLVRYEADASVIVGGFSEGDDAPFPTGSRWPLDSPGVLKTVRQTGRPARIDDYAHWTGEIATVVRGAGMRLAVATPIVVERRLWGAMVALSPRHEPFPEDTEAQLTDFTELVATAIASAESRAAIGRLGDEQAALRRVATLVARGTEPVTVFRAVCDEAQALLGADRAGILRFHDDRTVTVMASSGGSGEHGVGARVSFDPGFVVDRVHETHQAERFDTDDPAAADMPEIVRTMGVRSAVGSPIVVDGELWGVITLASVDRSLPLEMERRLADFTELVATAISNAQAHGDLQQLADEQAAVGRVATLVAQGARPAEIFAAVSAEVDRVFGLDPATFDVAVVGRFEPGPELVIVGISKSVDVGPLGSRWPMDDLYAPTHVLRTGRSARIRADDVVSAGGEVAEFLRHSGYLSQVASPIVVDGHLWGAMLVTTRSDLPPDTEERLEQFTELVATAIANTESREALARLAEEQAALRRVATLVAENVPSGELCAAVVREAGTLLGTDYAGLIRYEDDATVANLASWAATGELPPIPDRFPTEPGDPAAMIADARRPTRVDDWTVVPGPLAAFLRDELAVRSSVGSPIVVEGRLWGVLGVHSKGHVPLPPDTESRIQQFTELVATAIANREARTEAARLADEQAALRRVATLVARDAPREEVFTGIASEIGDLFGLEEIRMVRYEDDRTGVVVASSGPSASFFPVGFRVPADDEGATSRVFRTGESVRLDEYDYGTATGAIPERVRSIGIRSVVAAPITAGTAQEEPLPRTTESRLSQFTELMATAVANAESKTELAASRRRIVAASDEARRRFERDLHDGVQQRLVTLGLELRGAEAMASGEDGELGEQLAKVGDGLGGALDDLRELSRGIHPAILSEGGLVPALKVLSRRSAVPVGLELAVDERLPDQIEVAAYYVVSEALTNVAKHANASGVDVRAQLADGALELTIEDNGVGGAEPPEGSGLTGLADRVDALGGSIAITSPQGGGTCLRVQLPLGP
jgi:signal transduction histidine kinase